jgi:hypothetical protein
MGRQRQGEEYTQKGGSLRSPFCFSNFSIAAEPAGRIIIRVQFTSGTRKGSGGGGGRRRGEAAAEENIWDRNLIISYRIPQFIL